MATEAQLLQQFRNGLITLQTHLSALPYIGNYLTGRLHAQNLDTVQQLVNRVRGKTTEQVYDLLTEITANERSNRCSRGYHIRAFNKSGYTTLRNTLAAVRQHWARYANSLPVPPVEAIDRDQSTAICSCITDQAACEALQRGRVCIWRSVPAARRRDGGRGGAGAAQDAGQARCIPRGGGRAPAFEGIEQFAGQREEQGIAPPRARFFQQWRIPDNVI
jgi:hypothetical protein